MERRLATIVAADVVSYSRLIRADEEGTLLALRELRQDLTVDLPRPRTYGLITSEPSIDLKRRIQRNLHAGVQRALAATHSAHS